MVGRRTRKGKADELFQDEVSEDAVAGEPRVAVPVRASAVKAVHIEPAEIITALNNAVSGINAVFQARDGLMAEVAELKSELGVAKDVRVEQSRIDALKREQEAFQYDYKLRKERLEQELETLENDRREKIGRMESEAREKLKNEADEQSARLKMTVSEHALKLKTEREDHDRKIKLEREDFERAKALFTQERAAFDTRLKSFEAERTAMRERLVAELNRDNEHQIKVNALNHQREVEILKSQLKLEQANVGKFEGLLAETRVQSEKLAEQISTLSREALASASNSAMSVQLKDVIAKMNPQGSTARGV